jgi:hypothetical protein
LSPDAPRPAPAPAPRRSWGLAALLATLVMLGPFSIDLYLPAFGAIGGEFGVPQVALQATLSAYLFAYAFMMLWHGALSDALGRRPRARRARRLRGGDARLRDRREHRIACSSGLQGCRPARGWSSVARSSATATMDPRRRR